MRIVQKSKKLCNFRYVERRKTYQTFKIVKILCRFHSSEWPITLKFSDEVGDPPL